MARKKKDSRKRQQRLQARRQKEKEKGKRRARSGPSGTGTLGGVREISPEELAAAYVDPPASREKGARRPAEKRRGRPRKPVTQVPSGEPAGGSGRGPDERELSPHAIERSGRYRHWAGVCARIREQAVDADGNFRLSRLERRLRHWLYRARLRKLKGELRSWQITLVEETGYDWTVAERQRERKEPVKKKKRPKEKLPEKKTPIWEEWVGRIRQAAAEQEYDFFHLRDPALRRWLRNRRAEYRRGELRPEVHAALKGMGFDWDRTELSDGAYEVWAKNLEAYRELVRAVGKGAVPDKKKFYGLYVWFGRQRWLYRRGDLSVRRKRALDAAGFPWSERPMETRRWWEFFDRLKAFHRKYGQANITQTDPGDPSLGRWLARQRRACRQGRLSPAQEQALDSLGIDPNPRPGHGGGVRVETSRSLQDGLWLRRYEELAVYCGNEHGGRLPDPRRLPGRLERWLAAQRRCRRKGRLNERQIQMLDELGMAWDLPALREVRWRSRYEELKRFEQGRGHTRVPSDEGAADLAAWVERQRFRYRRGRLREDRKRLLDEIGFSLELEEKPSAQWMRHYEELKDFRREHGHCRVPRQYPPNQGLAEWAAQQKQRHKNGLLKRVHIDWLESIGFSWAVPRAKKDRGSGSRRKWRKGSGT